MTARIRQLVRLAAPVALLALGLLVVPTTSAGNPCYDESAIPPAASGTDTEIKLLPCAFAPTVTYVAVGSEVTFFNGPNFSHLITGANREWGSADVEIQPGQKVSYTFDTAGIYPYACVLHPGMSGAIVVGDIEAAPAPGAGTTSGASTDTETGANSSAAGGPTAAEASTAAPTPGSATDGLVLAGLGIAAGLVAGVAAAWIAFRRRPTEAGRPTSSAEAQLLRETR